MRCGLALGSGSATPPIAARVARGQRRLAGQHRKREAFGRQVLRVGRTGIVSAGMRTVIGCATPSTSIVGHAFADGDDARDGDASGPSTTYRYRARRRRLTAVHPARIRHAQQTRSLVRASSEVAPQVLTVASAASEAVSARRIRGPMRTGVSPARVRARLRRR